jgi:hypothetical protein
MTQASKQLQELRAQEVEQEPSLEAMLPELDLSDSKTQGWLAKVAREARAKQELQNSFKSPQGSDETVDFGANHMHRYLVRRQSKGQPDQTQG